MRGMENILYTRKEVANQVRLCLRSVDEAVARGDLIPTRFGKAVRFTPEAVQSWIDRKTDKTVTGGGHE